MTTTSRFTDISAQDFNNLSHTLDVIDKIYVHILCLNYEIREVDKLLDEIKTIGLDRIKKIVAQERFK